VESDLSRKRTRRYVVRATEGREEVVERVLGQVDRCELETHLVLIPAEDVVVFDGNVEKASRPVESIPKRKKQYLAGYVLGTSATPMI
jgi:hypothetical protein